MPSKGDLNMLYTWKRFKLFLLLLLLVIMMNYLFVFYLTISISSASDRWFQRKTAYITDKSRSYIQTFPFTRKNLNRTLRILMWTPFFGDPKWGFERISDAFSNCHSDCVLTIEKSDIVHADIVVFHVHDLWNRFLGYELPNHRRQEQVFVHWSAEPPTNVPLNYAKFKGYFNWTATYRTDSDVHFSYGRFTRKQSEDAYTKDFASTKSAGIAWIASNCGDDARRQLLVRKIQKHIQVDTFGQCGEASISKKNAEDILRKYKFYLSFESSVCRDYITEKFFRSYKHHSIPVVLGGANYEDVAPSHSYIDVSDFNNVEELVQHLKYLDKNDTAYNSYFEWTKSYVATSYSGMCVLCEAAHDGSRVHQVYTDMENYMKDDFCQIFTLPRYLSRMVSGYMINLGII